MSAALTVLALGDDGTTAAVYGILAVGIALSGVIAFSMARIELDDRWHTVLPLRVLRWSLIGGPLVLAVIAAGGLLVM